MKNAVSLLLATFLSVAAFAQEKPRECTLCIGQVADQAVPPSAAIPILIEASEAELETTAAYIASLSPEQRAQVTLSIDASLPEGATVADVDQRVDSILTTLRKVGGLAHAGIHFRGATIDLHAYALKRLAVAIQGEALARAIVLPMSDTDALAAIFTTGAQAYFDSIVTGGNVEALAKWLAANDPSKRILAVTAPTTPNPAYGAAVALARGASVAFVRTTGAEFAAAAAQINRELSGDYAFDQSSRIEVLDRSGAKTDAEPIAFVRGEDLRTIIFTPGETSAPHIVSFPSDEGMNPRRIDAAGAAAITDAGKRSRRLLVGVQPGEGGPFAISIDRPAYDDASVTKERIDVATRRSLPVEEIIRNHQAYESFQNSIAPRYIAKNETKLRFGVGAGERIEATLAGDHFFDPHGTNDWMWKDLYINGVRWKYGRIPEIPIVQPEKVTQLPLDIHLTNDYLYTLVGTTRLGGYDVYEVRFEPPRQAPAELPLYRGTVWIDTRSWARIRLRMLQLNLKGGEVLSNEEQVDFVPFDRATRRLLSPNETGGRDAKTIVWLPTKVVAQQVLSTAGRTTAVERTTDFTNFRIDPDDYAKELADAHASDARMVRDTEQGLRYLEPAGGGERVVKEGFDTARLFLVGGLHHDEGLDIPVAPLGGIDYFNFNLAGKGLQTNVFFAGIVLAANLTNPSFRGTRTNIGGDVFGLAIAMENTMFRNGEEVEGEAVKTLPLLVAGRVGHPIGDFGKADLSVGVTHMSYQRAEETAPGFEVPVDGFIITPGIDLSYERRGYTAAVAYEQGFRTKWQPWGNLDEYDEDHKNFTRFRATLGKSFYLPKFQRIGIEVNYLDGRNLDRFSKYELGFFGPLRVRGARSGSVRAERGFIGHLSYGFVISDQLRLEAFYDHALLDDATANYRGEPFQGVGLAGQIIGPWGTLMRIDVGKTIGTNAQDDFVADIVFLKIFG